MVLTRCAPAQNISVGQAEIHFPVKLWATRTRTRLEQGSTQWQDDQKPFNITIADLSNSSNLRSQWIALPIDQFGPVSGGTLVYLPRDADNLTQAVVGCSVSASWFSGEATSDSLANEAAWSFTDASKSAARIWTHLNASSVEAHRYRRLITIRERWVQSLTPLIPCKNCENQSERLTTLQQIFSDVGLSTVLQDMRTQGQPRWNETTKRCVLEPSNPSDTDVDRWNRGDCANGNKNDLLEFILASIFANGLSRYGSRHAFDASSMNASDTPFRWEIENLPRASDYDASLLSNKRHRDAILPPPAGSDYITLQMRIQVVGYAWFASGFSEYLAITVVIVYMLVALAHTVWVLAKGVTSSSWDTVTELLALALQSPIPETLNGSGAGIERLGTYKHIARLRTTKEVKEGRVVLVIDPEAPDEAARARYSRIEVDEDYL